MFTWYERECNSHVLRVSAVSSCRSPSRAWTQLQPSRPWLSGSLAITPHFQLHPATLRSTEHPLDLLGPAPGTLPVATVIPCLMQWSYLALCSDSCHTVSHVLYHGPLHILSCIGSYLDQLYFVYVNTVEVEVRSTREVGDPRRPHSRACQIVPSSIVGTGI